MPRDGRTPLTPAQAKESLALRLIAKTLIRDGHQIWVGACDQDGYGLIHFSGKGLVRTTHASWFLNYGYWPKQLNHYNSCHQPSCINVGCLYEGTPAQNTADAEALGTIDHRSESRSHLNATQVVEIRSKYSRYLRNSAKLAKEYGVSQAVVHNAVKGKTWKNI